MVVARRFQPHPFRWDAQIGACGVCYMRRAYRLHQGFWWRLLSSATYRTPRPGSLAALLEQDDESALEFFRDDGPGG